MRRGEVVRRTAPIRRRRPPRSSRRRPRPRRRRARRTGRAPDAARSCPPTSASPSPNVAAWPIRLAGTNEKTASANAASAREFSRMSTRLSHCEMTFSWTFCGRWVESSRYRPNLRPSAAIRIACSVASAVSGSSGLRGTDVVRLVDDDQHGLARLAPAPQLVEDGGRGQRLLLARRERSEVDDHAALGRVGERVQHRAAGLPGPHVEAARCAGCGPAAPAAAPRAARSPPAPPTVGGSPDGEQGDELGVLLAVARSGRGAAARPARRDRARRAAGAARCSRSPRAECADDAAGRLPVALGHPRVGAGAGRVQVREVGVRVEHDHPQARLHQQPLEHDAERVRLARAGLPAQERVAVEAPRVDGRGHAGDERELADLERRAGAAASRRATRGPRPRSPGAREASWNVAPSPARIVPSPVAWRIVTPACIDGLRRRRRRGRAAPPRSRPSCSSRTWPRRAVAGRPRARRSRRASARARAARPGSVKRRPSIDVASGRTAASSSRRTARNRASPSSCAACHGDVTQRRAGRRQRHRGAASPRRCAHARRSWWAHHCGRRRRTLDARSMILAADYPFMEILWTMILFFGGSSGSGRSSWSSPTSSAATCRAGPRPRGRCSSIFLPFLGVLLYLIAHGKEMGERRSATSSARWRARTRATRRRRGAAPRPRSPRPSGCSTPARSTRRVRAAQGQGARLSGTIPRPACGRAGRGCSRSATRR